ncbi:MAG: class I SAM-dependent methyltransferase [Candidatus Portnoybacteria bacterium]|nr:class I SAM-dependent methyltransferase [Candidatus Portnoybacteria bacterium]
MFLKIKRLSNSRFLIKRLMMKFIISQVKGVEFDVAIDLGAGRAPYRKFIRCRKYIAIDKGSSNNLENFIQADLGQGIPLEDNFADLVLATELLEHIKKPEFLLREVNRILKQGGRLILTTPFVWPLHEEPNDFWRFTKYGLGNLLKESGFVNIKIEPSNNFSVTILQLANTGLASRIFKPLWFIFNIKGIILQKFGRNYSLPVCYFVSACK